MLWTHNDSGDRARLFALSSQGKLMGTVTLPAVEAKDWEDIALGPGKTAGEARIYVADIGDNARRRPSVFIHRIAEPDQVDSKTRETARSGPVETVRLTYPDGAHDAETLLVDPESGEVVVVTKALFESPRVYFVPSLGPSPQQWQSAGELDPQVTGAKLLLATGGDVSRDGRWVLVRSYQAAFLWQRDRNRPLHEVFRTRACEVPLASEPQGEAIAFSRAGDGYYSLSENVRQPLYFYAVESPSAERSP